MRMKGSISDRIREEWGMEECVWNTSWRRVNKHFPKVWNLWGRVTACMYVHFKDTSKPLIDLKWRCFYAFSGEEIEWLERAVGSRSVLLVEMSMLLLVE
jgi:hypothetical protein